MNVNKALADVLQEIEQLEKVARALERLARSRGKRGRLPGYALARNGEKRTLSPRTGRRTNSPAPDRIPRRDRKRSGSKAIPLR